MKNRFEKSIHLLVAIIALLLITYSSSTAVARSGIEVSANSTEHTVVIPYEKSFLFVATASNDGDTTETVLVSIPEGEGQVPQSWHLLAPVGRYELAPGQKAEYVAVFEPGVEPGVASKEETVTVPIEFQWEGGNKKFDVTVKTKHLSLQNMEDDQSKVTISVIDKKTKKAISNASVAAILPSGIEQLNAKQQKEDYLLDLPSGDYLEQVANEYKIDQTSTGYLLRTTASGYKSYFESDFLPKTGDSKKTIALEPLQKIGKYKLTKTVESGYSIWWIKASADNKLIAFSQGAHENPGEEPPGRTKVILTDNKGEVLWERETGGECWGLDISPDGQYVAAGCHDGKIYVWDKEGNEIWEYGNGEGTRVRWVKFSPDGRQLLSGPVDNRPEQSGLFDVETGNLIWSFFTGDYLREGRFSADGSVVYLASANGILHALDTSTGGLKWLGSGGYYIPFMLGIADKEGLAIASGKGRAFTALDLKTGERRWQTIVDQTITAGKMAADGSVVASTVGGMAYGLSEDGEFIWARQYGGAGHNGVCYTRNGKYSLFGGPNPTLFDRSGNVLWQREPGKEIKMTGPVERDNGGNVVWLSDDASILVVGQGDGDIQFYQGQIKQGENDYSQLTGSFRGNGSQREGDASGPDSPKEPDRQPNWPVLIAGGFSILLLVSLVMVLVRRSKK